MRRRGRGLRERRGLLDLTNPMGEGADIGEDAGVGGMSAVQAPAGQPHQNPQTNEVTDKATPHPWNHPRKDGGLTVSNGARSEESLPSTVTQVDCCEGPNTGVPWKTSLFKSCRQALASCFRKLLTDPQDNHRFQSIRIWAPVPGEALDVQNKALSKAEKGPLYQQGPRELVWEWSLAS